MCNLDEKYLSAVYRKNLSSGSRRCKSQLVHALWTAEWVPQENGDSVEFVRPTNAERERLPNEFPFDAGQKWLDAIDFGVTAKKRSEEYRERNYHAKILGFESATEAAKMAEIAKLCRKEGRSPDELVSHLTPSQKKPETSFPIRLLKDKQRRVEKFIEQFGSATVKTYEPRMRSVRITQASEYTRAWLKAQYTNEFGIMVCQICKKGMPFKKRNMEEYYFEAVEALSKAFFSKEHEAQFLALCPLCAARYKEFIKHDENTMRAWKAAILASDSSEVPLALGDLKTSIRFVETHFNDITTILTEEE